MDEKGAAIILKNNTPRYLVIEFSSVQPEETADDEDIALISKRFIKKNKQAYEALAK